MDVKHFNHVFLTVEVRVCPESPLSDIRLAHFQMTFLTFGNQQRTATENCCQSDVAEPQRAEGLTQAEPMGDHIFGFAVQL